MFLFSSRRRHTRCALVTGVQTCALPICRSALIRDVPISISAVSQAQLERSGASEAKDIVKMVPGLAFTENSSGQAVLAVRGVQSTAVFGNLQQTVALYHDDVPVLDLEIGRAHV